MILRIAATVAILVAPGPFMSLAAQEKPAGVRGTVKRVAPDGYAAGWMLTQWEWGSGTVLTHAGATPMNYCVIWLAPDQKFAVMVAANIGPDRAAQPCGDVCGQLMELFLQ